MDDKTKIDKKKRQSGRVKKPTPEPEPKKPTIISDIPFKVFFGFKPSSEE